MSALGVVMVTYNRREAALASLALVPRGVPVCVVDNASSDGTVEAVRAAHPHVDVLALDRNLGAGGRTIGAERLGTTYVAFADDDSWWAPGALERAVGRFEADPELGLLAARVLVGPDERLDPVCAELDGAAEVLGFVACGAIVRTAAFLSVGGFDGRYGIGGEETRLAVDLAAAGWRRVYDPAVVAHHHPLAGGRPGRSWRALRNDLWTDWLRRSLVPAVTGTVRRLLGASPPVAARASVEAARGLPWVLRERRVVPPDVEAGLDALDDDAR